MAKHQARDANKDLYENRHLYEDEPSASDQTLTIIDEQDVVEEDDTLAGCSAEALTGLLQQYQKDLLFEQDRQTRRDLRDRITAIQAEIGVRKTEGWSQSVQRTLAPEPERKRSEARLDADAAWQWVTRRNL